MFPISNGMNSDDQITYFAETDSRNKRLRFGIKAKDRTRHVYTIGKTGMGKSTLLENMAIQDIQNGNGMAFIDPHGKTAEFLLSYVPESRIKDVLYFAPFDMDYPVSFNVMEDVGADKRHLVANGLMSAFKKIWVDAWSARMEYILNNILLALLEYPDSTLLGVNRMLADKQYRKKVVENISDPSVKSFWVDEFEKYGEKYMQEAGAAIQNKIGQFISNPLIRNIIGQPKSTFDFRKMMDEQKIIIVNLSKGQVGESNANLLGGMLITKIYLSAMSRADVSNKGLETLPNFYLFVDEFQNFANESFADILSEARKYKLNLTMAHQYIEQMTEEVRAAVFGNVGTMVAFRVGSYDAEVLEKEFAPVFVAQDIVNLDKFQIYLRLMIDGVGSQPFSARTIPTPPTPAVDFVEDIINSSRKIYAMDREAVEEAIKVWHSDLDGNKNNGNQKQGNGQGQQGGERKSFDVNRRPAPVFQSEKKVVDENVKNFERDNKIVKKVTDIRPQPERKIEDKHNPFKKVFENVRPTISPEEKKARGEEREASLRQAVSLKYLKKDEGLDANGEKKFDPNKDKKGITGESLSELRSALSSVLKEAGIGVDKKPEAEKAPETPKTPESKSGGISSSSRPIGSTQGNFGPQNGKIKEVSESELKQILSVEE